jgi:hypothetical protein
VKGGIFDLRVHFLRTLRFRVRALRLAAKDSSRCLLPQSAPSCVLRQKRKWDGKVGLERHRTEWHQTTCLSNAVLVPTEVRQGESKTSSPIVCSGCL